MVHDADKSTVWIAERIASANHDSPTCSHRASSSLFTPTPPFSSALTPFPNTLAQIVYLPHPITGYQKKSRGLAILKVPRPTNPGVYPEVEDEPSATPEGDDSTFRAPDNAKPALVSRSLTHSTRTHTCMHVLQPLLIPSFPPTLLPITPIFEPPPSHEQVTETDSSLTTTTALASRVYRQTRTRLT
jgi:hypothetical protein